MPERPLAGPGAYRHLWLPELLVLGTLAVLTTLPFWLSDLDLRLAAVFHHPQNHDDPWPEGAAALWQFFYGAAPVLAALLAAGALAVLALAGLHEGCRRRRLHAWFLLLVVVLGPGVLVNAVFKDHWGRPRPRQVEALGGSASYLPPLLKGEDRAARSFPSGHSSVGFSLIAFWFIWRRRRPALAVAALLASLTLGALFGAGRMAAGAHFASDVLWSAYLPAFAALVLYHFVLRIPAREDLGLDVPRPRHRWLSATAWGTLAALVLGGVLLNTPFHQQVSWTPRVPPTALSLRIDEARVHVELAPGAPLTLRASGRGAGLPGSALVADRVERDGGVAYTLRHRGYQREIASQVSLRVDPDALERLEVELGRGDITVTNAGLRTRFGSASVRTGNGRVRWLE